MDETWHTERTGNIKTAYIVAGKSPPTPSKFDVNRMTIHPRERRPSPSALFTWYRGGDAI